MTLADLSDFGSTNLRRPLLRGGLPPFWLSKEVPERDFQEWVDAYWAKDVLELFRLERRRSFQGLFELLLRQSGGMFEATVSACLACWPDPESAISPSAISHRPSAHIIRGDHDVPHLRHASRPVRDPRLARDRPLDCA